MLFGEKFDFDERAEVGGGLLFREMKLADGASTVLLEDRAGLTEDGFTKVVPTGDLDGDGGDFIAVHLSNSGWRHGLHGSIQSSFRRKVHQ